MMAVTVGGPGFVAVGEESFEDGTTGNLAVWVSGDGITWNRVPHEAAFGGEELTNVWLKDVTAFGAGLVAVGVELTGDSADAAATFWSRPGSFGRESLSGNGKDPRKNGVQPFCIGAQASMSRLRPWSSKITQASARSPVPLISSTTPLPHLPCTTRSPTVISLADTVAPPAGDADS